MFLEQREEQFVSDTLNVSTLIVLWNRSWSWQVQFNRAARQHVCHHIHNNPVFSVTVIRENLSVFPHRLLPADFISQMTTIREIFSGIKTEWNPIKTCSSELQYKHREFRMLLHSLVSRFISCFCVKVWWTVRCWLNHRTLNWIKLNTWTVRATSPF